MTTAPIRAWDLPTRLVHWTLAGLFLGAFAVAHLANEHRPAFAIHMLLGLILMGAMPFRLVWGLVGSRHARFASFLHSPAALLRCLRDVAAGRDRPYAGHNPGSSWAIYGMLLIPPAMITGARRGEPAGDIGSSRPVAGLIFLALVAGWAALVLRGHDPVARQVRIPALGLTVPVSEKIEPPRPAATRRTTGPRSPRWPGR